MFTYKSIKTSVCEMSILAKVNIYLHDADVTQVSILEDGEQFLTFYTSMMHDGNCHAFIIYFLL